MKILITGPESSGKTYLANALGKALNISVVEEYARTYLEENGPEYTCKDLSRIAGAHLKQVDTFNHDRYILDTFLLNIKIWSQDKFDRCEPWIIKEIEQLSFDKVLVLAPNIEWQPDPLREDPSNRTELFDKFIEELDALKWDYAIIDKLEEERIKQALDYINS